MEAKLSQCCAAKKQWNGRLPSEIQWSPENDLRGQRGYTASLTKQTDYNKIKLRISVDIIVVFIY